MCDTWVQQEEEKKDKENKKHGNNKWKEKKIICNTHSPFNIMATGNNFTLHFSSHFVCYLIYGNYVLFLA